MKDVHADAVALRGIIDYLQATEEPVRTGELAMVEHIGDPAALGLCRILERAGYIEHPVIQRAWPRTRNGTTKDVIQNTWRLTKEFEQNGCVFDAEALAGGRA